MEFIWHQRNNYFLLTPITQVYGLCFDGQGNILIMRTPGKSWNLPGGTPKPGEAPEMTLLRELEEEVNITISKSKMIGYFEVVSNKPTIYQLRYAALIDEINPSQIDPALNVINERKLINPNEFFNYIKYEDCGPMLNEAVAWFKNPN